MPVIRLSTDIHFLHCDSLNIENKWREIIRDLMEFQIDWTSAARRKTKLRTKGQAKKGEQRTRGGVKTRGRRSSVVTSEREKNFTWAEYAEDKPLRVVRPFILSVLRTNH